MIVCEILDAGRRLEVPTVIEGADMKKTFVMDVDGKPGFAFRAEHAVNAAAIVEAMYNGPLKRPNGVLTVRPATIDERQRWQSESVDSGDEHPEQDHDALIVPLDED